MPSSFVPALSINFGIRANTEGVYPLVAGGSPIASPTSLCAIAIRVIESNINKTSIPLSRKYSAIDVATKAALILTKEGCSDVAAMTIERFIPSVPRISSINSLTSRPRSPIRAITFKSAEVFFAIMPRVVLLPTPEPAKIPIR